MKDYDALENITVNKGGGNGLEHETAPLGVDIPRHNYGQVQSGGSQSKHMWTKFVQYTYHIQSRLQALMVVQGSIVNVG